MVRKRTIFIQGEREVELNYFKDILFDLVNDWEQDILEVFENYNGNTLWVVMGDGSVFRIQCEKEPFHLFKPPQSPQ